MRFVPGLIGTVMVMCIPVAAQTPLTYQEYEKELSELLSRDQQFREGIAQEQARIKDCKQHIEDSKKRTLALREKKLSLLGISEDELYTIDRTIDTIIGSLSAIQKYQDRQFLAEADQVREIRNECDTLAGNPSMRISRIQKKLAEARRLLEISEVRLADIESKNNEIVQIQTETVASQPSAPESFPGSYTVGKIRNHPETLFDIAEKMYGDPYRWPEIYQANREVLDRNFNQFRKTRSQSTIANPSDLILPGQVLVIPR